MNFHSSPEQDILNSNYDIVISKKVTLGEGSHELEYITAEAKKLIKEGKSVKLFLKKDLGASPRAYKYTVAVRKD